MKKYHEALHAASIPVGAFMHKTFTAITVDGPPLDRVDLRKNSTMIVGSHRSHIDYILLGIEFHKLGLDNLRFAAGDNLTSMPYVGAKFTSYGAFPVYRAQAHRRNYIFELAEQVVDMLTNGDTIIVFPEGGRSYNGAMLEMKSGILAASIIAQHRNPDRNFVYLPATVSYERLPELLYFETIGKGRELRAKKGKGISRILGNALYFGGDLYAIAKFMLAHHIRRNYGALYIDYGAPVAIRDIVDLKKNYHSQARNEFFGHKVSIQITGDEIRRQLILLYRILPMHIIASIVNTGGTVARTAALGRVAEIVERLVKTGRNCRSIASLSEKDILDTGIRQLGWSRSITVRNGVIAPKNRALLNYYAATLAE